MPVTCITWRQYLSRSQQLPHTSCRDGGIPSIVPNDRLSDLQTRQLFCLQKLAASFASPKKSTPLQSSKSSLFLQNTGGGGVSVPDPSLQPQASSHGKLYVHASCDSAPSGTPNRRPAHCQIARRAGFLSQAHPRGEPETYRRAQRPRHCAGGQHAQPHRAQKIRVGRAAVEGTREKIPRAERRGENQ